jgi:hypothetical protein
MPIKDTEVEVLTEQLLVNHHWLSVNQAVAHGAGDLNKINSNFKLFQIINHFWKYFTQITPFGRASEGGVA